MLAALSPACDRAAKRPQKIAILNPVATMRQSVAGFMDVLAEEGLRQGTEITYFYDGPLQPGPSLAKAAARAVAAKPDLFFCLTTPAALAVKRADPQSVVPVIFASVSFPKESGLVEDLQSPGGRMSGVALGNFIPLALHWLRKILPDLKNLYVPYNPEDISQSIHLTKLRQAASAHGVKLIIRKVHTHPQALAALASVPAEAQAMIELPSGFWSPLQGAFARSSLVSGMPLVGANEDWVRAGALLSVGLDNYQAGRKAGRLALKVLDGIPPARLPVEFADFRLHLNLRAAAICGIHIPSQIVKQATGVVWP